LAAQSFPAPDPKCFPEAGKRFFRAGYGITYTREGFNNFDSIAYGNPGIDGSIFANSVPQPCSAAAAPGIERWLYNHQWSGQWFGFDNLLQPTRPLSPLLAPFR